MKEYCENCKGGTKRIFSNSEELIRYEWEEITCPKCDGKGYIEV